jgi:anti-sigma regulatory factor (Ser/Thr protein kinase)
MDDPLTLSLPRDPQAAAIVRRWVAAEFGERLAPKRLADLQLVASELVTNAIRHGEGQVTVRVGGHDEAIVIEVVDEGEGEAPCVRPQPADETGGWGLQIVDRVALAWGAFEGTTHVWAELPAQPD